MFRSINSISTFYILFRDLKKRNVMVQAQNRKAVIFQNTGFRHLEIKAPWKSKLAVTKSPIHLMFAVVWTVNMNVQRR